MAISIVEFLAGEYAKGIVENMPERQLKKFCNLPEKVLEKMMHKIYDLIKKEIEKQFIKIAIEELKKRANVENTQNNG